MLITARFISGKVDQFAKPLEKGRLDWAARGDISMGKQIRVQRRGRGAPTFRAHTFHRVAPSHYPPASELELKGVIAGRVLELLHDPGRGAPLALLEFDDGSVCCIAAPEGIAVDQTVLKGAGAVPDTGNILPLGSIPEGTLVCNVEISPNDGGRLARASGAYAMVVAHTPAGTEVRLPSGRTVYLSDRCRAMVGVIAGAGRVDKPFIKAGNKYHYAKSKGRVWPITKGQAMTAASHPHGGGRHKHAGKPTTVPRTAPPGRKVGLIAARKSGRAKRVASRS